MEFYALQLNVVNSTIYSWYIRSLLGASIKITKSQIYPSGNPTAFKLVSGVTATIILAQLKKRL